MYKIIRNCNSIPTWLKVLINVLLTVTVVYWLGYFIYKILEFVRFCINGITKEKGRWWFFILCCLILTISICLFMGFNPFTELWDWLVSTYENLIQNVVDKLSK